MACKSNGYCTGDLIYKNEPFAYCLYKNQQGELCDYCFSTDAPTYMEESLLSYFTSPPKKTLKRCSKCQYALFCGKNCQKQGWQDHKRECKRLKYLTTNAEDVDLVRFIGRVIFKLQDPKAKHVKDSVGSYSRSFNDLISHKEERKHDHTEQMRALHIMEQVNAFIGSENMPSLEEFLEIYGKIITNQTAVYDGTEDERGVCLYLGASIFDHACIPNAVFSFQKKTVYVRALKNIPDADMKKVNVSYIKLLNFDGDPYRIIHRQFFTLCKCADCSLPYGESTLTKILDKNVSAEVVTESQLTLKKIESMDLKGIERLKILEMCEECLKKQEGVLGDTNLLRVRMICYAWYAAMTVPKALMYMKMYLNCVKLCFGENSFHVANVYNQLGKVHMTMNTERENAVRYFKKTRDIIQTIYGRDHILVKRTELSISECMVLSRAPNINFLTSFNHSIKTGKKL